MKKRAILGCSKRKLGETSIRSSLGYVNQSANLVKSVFF